MGLWYFLAIAVGVAIYIKTTFFNKKMPWKSMVHIQLSMIGFFLALFGVFMLTPISTNLIDVLFK